MNPNCPSCNVPLDNGICPSCGYDVVQHGAPLSAVASRASAPILRPTRSNQGYGRAQVVICIDRTGSSGPFAVGVTAAVRGILDAVKQRAREVKCWVRTYGDLECGEEHHLLTDGGTCDEAQIAVQNITFGGGGDAAETHVDGVDATYNETAWEVAATHHSSVLIVFATANSKPSRSGVTAKDLGRALRAKRVATFVIAESYPWAAELAEAARGELHPISNNPDPATMAKIGAAVGKTVAQSISAPRANV